MMMTLPASISLPMIEPCMGGGEHRAQSRIGEQIVEPPYDLLAGAVVGLGMKAGLAVLEKLPRMRVELIEVGQPLDHHFLESVERRVGDRFDDGGNDVAKEGGLQAP